jgi:hypothetical protein
MIGGLLIKPDGEVVQVSVASLEDMQSLVGGYIELITLGDCDLYVNEDGIAMRLRPNSTATMFAVARLKKDGRLLLTKNGKILGNALFLGPCVEGEIADLPDAVVKEIQKE